MTREIRALEPRDVDGVVRVHLIAFGAPSGREAELGLAEYYRRLFLQSPFMGSRGPASLVAVEGGRVRGFLGILPRPFLFGERRITGGILHRFMVEPHGGAPLTAVRLIRAAFALGYDACWSDGANERGKDVFLGAGAELVVHRCLQWILPLKPCSTALAFFLDRRPGRFLSALVGLPDRLLGGSWRVPAETDFVFRPLEVGMHRRLIEEASARAILRPVYDDETLAWLHAFLRSQDRPNGRGRFAAALLCRGEREIGWCLGFVRRKGVHELLQLGATGGSPAEALEAARAFARELGAVALTGTLDAAHLPPLARRKALFKVGSYMFLRTDDPEIARAFHTGRVFLSGLEGELLGAPVGFHY